MESERDPSYDRQGEQCHRQQEKVRNRRRTCGSRLRFSKTYTMNSQGLIGVQNGM